MCIPSEKHATELKARAMQIVVAAGVLVLPDGTVNDASVPWALAR
jgi:hypothetical protein